MAVDVDKKSNGYDIVGLFKYSPAIIMVVYVLGFIVLNSHLASYGIYDYSFQSVLYLKTGVLTSLLFFPLGLMIHTYIKNPTDNFNVGKIELLNVATSLTLYTAFVIFLLFPRSHAPIIYILLYFGVCFIITSYAFRNVPKYLKTIVKILPPIIYIVRGIVLEGEYLLTYVTLNIGITWNAIDDYNAWGDKEYNVFKASFSVMLMVMLFAIFGLHVYKHIPNVYGGGFPRTKTLYLDNSCGALLTGRLNNVKNCIADNQVIIHENDGYVYLLLSDNASISIKRNMVLGEYSKTKMNIYDNALNMWK